LAKGKNYLDYLGVSAQRASAVGLSLQAFARASQKAFRLHPSRGFKLKKVF
jgi:hypothetical protein